MNVAPAYNLIQLEEVDYSSPVSSSVFNRIAAVVNKALAEAQISSLGTVEISLLTENQFQAQKGSNWILMDGRDVTGSAYALAFGTNLIPDGRGLALRGKDNGAGQDSNGDLTTGTQITFTGNSSHNHASTLTITGSLYFSSYNNSITNNYAANTFNSGYAPFEVAPSPPNQILPAGGAEAIARNITVNYFIKIN